MLRIWLTRSWSGLRDEPSGATSPIAYRAKGRSRLTCALIPSRRFPAADTRRPSAAAKAIRQAGGATPRRCQAFHAGEVQRGEGRVVVVQPPPVAEERAVGALHARDLLRRPRVGQREDRVVVAAQAGQLALEPPGDQVDAWQAAGDADVRAAGVDAQVRG